MKVKVKEACLNNQKFAGRRGTVAGDLEPDHQVVYVDLEPANGERGEMACFWRNDLIFVDEACTPIDAKLRATKVWADLCAINHSLDYFVNATHAPNVRVR
jgi:hypothetical protein